MTARLRSAAMACAAVLAFGLALSLGATQAHAGGDTTAADGPWAAAVEPAEAASPATAVSASEAASATAVTASEAASATDEPGEVSTTVEVSGYVGWHHFGANSTLGRLAGTGSDVLDPAVRFGGRVTVMVAHHWFAEMELDVASSGLQSGRSSVTVIGLRPHAVFDILLSDVRPFILLGPSILLASPSNPLAASSALQVVGEFGGGLKVSLAPWWGVRADVRGQVQAGFSGPSVEWASMLSLFGLFPAPPKPPVHAVVIIPDSDGDGLNDELDRCPKEPGDLELHGCPASDRDGDGIADDADQCPRAAGPAGLGGCPPGDRDGDGVKDNVDACPDSKGVAERKGCPWPDGDGDGVPDKDDRCPDTAGRYSLQGCPKVDQDDDGVLDRDDKCPTEAGMAKYQGCPPTDKDKDGVVDWDDKCPDTAGTAELSGCPINDKDGDGVADGQDKCPNEAGIAKYQGCPPTDKDKDGVVDWDDKCPDAAGTAELSGCPINDKDGDTVPDEKDKCPEVKGVVEENGCPLADTDRDGVPDRFDKCPDRAAGAGAKGDGCPDDIPAEVRDFFGVIGKIDFEPGSAVLSAGSKPTLEKAAALIRANKGFNVEISGHTDNTGAAAVNTRISSQRAQAVRRFLIELGVEAKRLVAAGYGPTRPIADNATLEGRRANRRVEFKLTSE